MEGGLFHFKKFRFRVKTHYDDYIWGTEAGEVGIPGKENTDECLDLHGLPIK